MTNSSGFDVFVAYNDEDRKMAALLTKRLRHCGLKPWLDVEQVPPGKSFMEIIEAKIGEVGSAAILVGAAGLGRWQTLELRGLLEQCVESGIPVIPVLLPGVKEPPAGLRFLRQFKWVRFDSTLDEPSTLHDLIWGITGRRPTPVASNNVSAQQNRCRRVC